MNNIYRETATFLSIAAALAMAETEGTPVVNAAGVKVAVYGFASLDAAYEDSKSNNGNLSNYVSSSDLLNKNDGGWYLTPDLTRIGVNLSGPNVSPSIAVSGKIEVDFYGGGTEVNPVPRLRHGYGQVTFPGVGFTILGGQTSDVISPLSAPVLNAGALQNSGNLGSRRAQLRLSEAVPVGGGSLNIAAAVVRSVGVTQPYVTNSASETGSDADVPTFQGRVGVSLPLWVEKQKVNFGVSGHYGTEEIDLDSTGDTKNLSTWSLNGDLELPILGILSFVGEGFLGANLDAYFGNIGQGFTKTANPDDIKDVKGFGGWGAFRLNPSSSVTVNAGAGIDKVHRSTIRETGGREQNVSSFINAAYNITPAFKVGLEYFHIQTDYLLARSNTVKEADLNRYQLSLAYNF